VPNLTYTAHDRVIASWPTPLSIGMLTAAPLPDGTSVLEPSPTDGYARQPFTYTKSQLDGITTLANSANIVFGPAANPWTPVSYFGLFDANGVLVLYGRLRTTRSVDTGLSESFNIGAIQLRLR
jgi:hypothetical protein